jgi:short-subunit dehydrogenase
MGPFEEVTYEQSYTQMNTNVLGLASVTRAVLPILRENGGGRIINVSSIAGKVALPLSGWYCASKFAVEALSDTMRLELRQFGIKVVVIEPGPIRTNFGEVAYATADNVKPDSLYKPLLDRMKSWTKSTLNDNVAGKTDDVSKVILKALEKKNPRPRYRITGIAKFLYCVRRISSDRLLDLIFRKQMGLK